MSPAIRGCLRWVAVLVVFGTALPSRGADPPVGGVVEMRAFAASLIQEGLYDEAIEAYRAIAQVQPSEARAHYDLAGALGFVRRYAEAIVAVRRAIVLDASHARYFELAAVAHLELGQFAQAFEATRRGAELGDIKAMYSLAGMYEHGRGTVASAQNALMWLRRAAEGGHLSAMDAMSRVYSNGLYGIAPNQAQAAAWRRRLHRELALER